MDNFTNMRRTETWQQKLNVRRKKNPDPKVRGGHPENKIQCARIKSGYSQEKVSEVLSVTVRTVQHYEAGDTEPGRTNLKKMAILFNCSVDDLMPDEEDVMEVFEYVSI